MLRTAKSYFRPDGSCRGTVIIFVPEGEEKLADDGISIVRPDGSILRQENPYVSKERYTKENLIEVEGEFTGLHRLRNGRVEVIPEEDRPRKKSEQEEIAELKRRVAALESTSAKA